MIPATESAIALLEDLLRIHRELQLEIKEKEKNETIENGSNGRDHGSGDDGVNEYGNGIGSDAVP
jgi:hypothetical protein